MTYDGTMTLDTIREKLTRGGRLDTEDARAVWAARDLVAVGMLGDESRRRRHGNATTFVRVWDVRVEDASSLEVPSAAGELRVHVAGATIDLHVDLLREAVARAGRVPVTAGELHDLADCTPGEFASRLARLRSAGVWGVTAAAVDRLSAPVSVVPLVLDAGLRIGRFVVDAPDPAGPWAVLSIVEDVQQRTGAVRAFAPLPRQQTAEQPTTGYADVKTIALSRLVLEHVPSIQVDWTLHGPKLAQVALLFGADDVDSVSAADEIGTGRRRAPLEEILRNIRAAALDPVERDGRFDTRP